MDTEKTFSHTILAVTGLKIIFLFILEETFYIQNKQADRSETILCDLCFIVISVGIAMSVVQV